MRECLDSSVGTASSHQSEGRRSDPKHRQVTFFVAKIPSISVSNKQVAHYLQRTGEY